MRLGTLLAASLMLLACKDDPPPLPEGPASGSPLPTERPTVLTPVTGSRPYKGPGGLEARIDHLEARLASLQNRAMRTSKKAQYDEIANQMEATQKELDAAKAELAARDAGP